MMDKRDSFKLLGNDVALDGHSTERNPMRKLFIFTAIVVICWTSRTQAQIVVGTTRGGFATGGGVSAGNRNRGLSVSGLTGQTTIFRYGVIGVPYPGGFYGYAGGTWWGPPPIVVRPIIMPPPIIVQVQQPPQAVDLPPAVDPGRFNVITPDRPNMPPKLKLPEPKQQPLKAAPPKEPKGAIPKEVDLGVAPGEFPLAPGKVANPKAEAERQIEMGRTAFVNGEFGRAIERFRRASAVAPDEPTAIFLVAQAQFAVGKYDDAVASILDGMKRQPNWPTSAFQSRGLYKNNNELFEAHLKDLRVAVAANPNDYRLLFLLGVEFWFDGQKEAARPFLEPAARLAPNPAPIEAFLK
jgi:Flp pilus assembly protein TadD